MPASYYTRGFLRHVPASRECATASNLIGARRRFMIQKLRERLAPAPSSALQRFRGIGGTSLRVGIAFDGPRPPHWAAALVDFFGGLSGMETLTFTVGVARPNATPNPSWLARRLYSGTQRMQSPFDTTQPLPGQRPAASGINCCREMRRRHLGRIDAGLRSPARGPGKERCVHSRLRPSTAGNPILG